MPPIFSFPSLHPDSSEICFLFLFRLSVRTSVSAFTVFCRRSSTFYYEILSMCFSKKSSCQEKTARTAPSTAFPATGASTRTHPRTHRWPPLSARARLPRPRLSLCQVCHRRTPLQTELSRENRTPLRSGPSPGACMKVGVSILFLVAVG